MWIVEQLGNAYAWGWHAGEGQDFHGLGDGPAKVICAAFFGALLTLGLVMVLGAVGTFFGGIRRGFRGAPETPKAPASSEDNAGAGGTRESTTR